MLLDSQKLLNKRKDCIWEYITSPNRSSTDVGKNEKLDPTEDVNFGEDEKFENWKENWEVHVRQIRSSTILDLGLRPGPVTVKDSKSLD